METTYAGPGIKNISNLLRITYGVVPIVAGSDKFLNVLTQWEAYLPQGIENAIPLSGGTLMMIVGLIEIAAGIIVLKKPVTGGYIVSAWLVLIGLVLCSAGAFDIAVRDFVMAIGAYSMARLEKLK